MTNPKPSPAEVVDAFEVPEVSLNGSRGKQKAVFPHQ
jgi:hypothetical protein